jgi:hypothetical protein
LLVCGRLAEQLGAGGDVLSYLADLIYRTPYGILDLIGSLVRGVLDPLHSLPGLVGDAPEGTVALALLVLLALLFLVAFAHFSSPFGKEIVVGLGWFYPGRRRLKTPSSPQGRLALPRLRAGRAFLFLPPLRDGEGPALPGSAVSLACRSHYLDGVGARGEHAGVVAQVAGCPSVVEASLLSPV